MYLRITILLLLVLSSVVHANRIPELLLRRPDQRVGSTIAMHPSRIARTSHSRLKVRQGCEAGYGTCTNDPTMCCPLNGSGSCPSGTVTCPGYSDLCCPPNCSVCSGNTAICCYSGYFTILSFTLCHPLTIAIRYNMQPRWHRL